MQSMAVASNLSPDHNFLMFLRQKAEENDPFRYEPYNRFPIGTYALIKFVAVLSFEDDLSAQIYAARLLMLLFFGATAMLAYAAVARLVDNRWIAFAATLLTFSSYYWLFYNDMSSTEVTSLFGVAITFHGMVVFVQDNRLGQLLIKVCAALLLGWHVMALLFPFVVLGLASELISARSSGSTSSVLHQMKYLTAALIRSRYFFLGITALVFCALVMGFNITNEYFALNGEVSLSEIPTVRSYLLRTGVDSEYFSRLPDRLDWQPFLLGQFSRIGEMLAPFVILRAFDYSICCVGPLVYPPWAIVAGGLAFFASLAGLVFMRHKVLRAALLLSGWCWVIPLRGSAGIHGFETLFHFGVPLVFYSLLLLLIHRHVWGQDRVLTGLAAVAAAIFVLSVFWMDPPHDEETAAFHREVAQDFSTIRKSTAPGDVLFVMEYGERIWPRNMMNYYLNGRFVHFRGPLDDYGLTVATDRVNIDASLTPQNRHVFLHESSAGLLEAYRERFQWLLSAEYTAHSLFDIHAVEGVLYYIKDSCSWSDMETSFFLHVIPLDVSDLPDERREYGFDNLDFYFHDYGMMFDGNCLLKFPLPQYDINQIITG